jgi:uncharacterized protein (DUF1499 family)
MRFMNIVGKLAFAAFLLSLVVGLVASFGTRFHLWGFQVGLLKIFPFCLYLGLAGLALGVIWAVSALFMNSGVAARYGVIGLVGSIAVLALPMYNIYMIKVAHAIPSIHDISTDTEHPPLFVALLNSRPGALNPPEYEGGQVIKDYDGTSSTVTGLQKKYYTDLRPVEMLNITPTQLYDRALNAANSMGWTIVSAAREPNGGRIEASDTTFFFGFTDDIVIRVEPSGMGARLDIRSKSRVGMSDLGKNAARIRAYVKTLANS